MISGNPTALKRATCFLVRASWDKVHGLDPTMVEIRSFLPHKPFRAPKASVIQVLWVPDFIVAVLCRHWQGIGDTLHNAWYTSYFSSASWPWSWWLWFPNPNFHLLKLIDIDSDIDDQFDHMNEVKLTVNLTTKTQLVFKDHTLKNQSTSSGDLSSSSPLSCSDASASLSAVSGFTQPAAWIAKNHLSNNVAFELAEHGTKGVKNIYIYINI